MNTASTSTLSNGTSRTSFSKNQLNETTSASVDIRTPLKVHVKQAIEQYFVELEGQVPSNLYQTILQEVERPLLQVVLDQTEGNQSKTAKILGLNRGTLRKKMQQYDLL